MGQEDLNSLTERLGEAMNTALQDSLQIAELMREFKKKGLDVLLFFQADVVITDTPEFTVNSTPVGETAVQ